MSKEEILEILNANKLNLPNLSGGGRYCKNLSSNAWCTRYLFN